jgi:hypothetical protein
MTFRFIQNILSTAIYPLKEEYNGFYKCYIDFNDCSYVADPSLFIHPLYQQ